MGGGGRGLSRNGELSYYIEAFLESPHDTAQEKKSWFVYLTYVNKPALHNNCLSKIWDDLHCSSNSVDSLIAVLVIHANNKHFACFIFIFVPKKEHVYTYPTTNTLSQFHNQLQNKYIHINFIFSLGKCSNSSSGYGIVINVFGVVWAN